MSSIFITIVAIFLLMRTTYTDTGSLDLMKQLHTVLTQSDLSESPDAAIILQNLGKLKNNTDLAFQNDNKSFTDLDSACKVGQLLLGRTNFLDASSAGYSNVIDVNWSETSQLPAQCIFQPASNAGVAVSLQIAIYFAVKFAVRSGGHNANSGFGSIDGSGLLIDLTKLTALRISSDHTSVTVGPGNRWIDLYTYLDAYGLSAVGTKEPGPGVGGSILGGGDPFFPALYGFACDNVKDFEVVLSNSSIIHANANRNEDLFTALKGGGPNFGIVTAYTLYTHALHEAYWDVVSYPNTSNPALFAALHQFQQGAEDDPKANIIFTISGNVTVVGFLYAEYTAVPPTPFSGFRSIVPSATLIPPTNGTIKELCLAIGGLDSQISARRGIAAVSASGNDADLYADVNQQYQQLAARIPVDTSLVLSFQAVSRSTVIKSNSLGGNSMGITPQPQIWFAILMQWISPTDTDTSDHTIRSLTLDIVTSATKRDLQLPFLYQNDAAYFQSPLQSVGSATFAALEAASIKYDIARVFQRLQNGGFLLGMK